MTGKGKQQDMKGKSQALITKKISLGLQLKKHLELRISTKSKINRKNRKECWVQGVRGNRSLKKLKKFNKYKRVEMSDHR